MAVMASRLCGAGSAHDVPLAQSFAGDCQGNPGNPIIGMHVCNWAAKTSCWMLCVHEPL